MPDTTTPNNSPDSPDSGGAPVTDLHAHGLTFHQTRPLRDAGYTTVAALIELVAEHDQLGDASRLAQVPGMGAARVAKVAAAVSAWQATHPD